MVRLTHIPAAGDADIFVKMELLNPGFSVKDRIGIGMIEKAAKTGELKPGGTIIEPTAGNTGVGLALAGVRLGYRVILCVPENFSIEKREVMKALGGEVVLTPAADGMKAAIAKAQELSETIPDSYVPQQFANPYNTESHYETTGPEVWEQMDGRVDAWLAGAGTGGTFSGVAKYLKERFQRAGLKADIHNEGHLQQVAFMSRPQANVKVQVDDDDFFGPLLDGHRWGSRVPTR